MCHHWELEQNTLCYSMMMIIVTKFYIVPKKRMKCFKKIKSIVIDSKTEIGNAIKRLKSDKGDEFMSGGLNNLCKKEELNKN